MTSSAHTPGPWCVEDPMGPESLWIVQEDKETYEWFPIAVCNMPDEEDHNFTGSEVVANARLIAAAPELLEAAQAMDQFWKALGAIDEFEGVDADYERFERVAQLAHAAIAKATGAA